ncbi:hypothetical protein U1Q18_050036 [Sarracenia purpurea var. burkii]
MLAAYAPAYREIPLKLGFHFRPMFTSGPNTYKNPVKESTVVCGGILWSLVPEAGRFGRKLEGSGKLRLFAIANPIFQTLLRPLHDWVMSILSTLKMDGTYDQLAPLSRLKGKRELLSFDLKSATDLLPVDLSGSMLASLFGNEFAQSWCYLMAMVMFRSPDKVSPKVRARVYRFTRGQPLGYYSSWPVFTLTHHMLVWLAFKLWDLLRSMTLPKVVTPSKGLKRDVIFTSLFRIQKNLSKSCDYLEIEKEPQPIFITVLFLLAILTYLLLGCTFDSASRYSIQKHYCYPDLHKWFDIWKSSVRFLVAIGALILLLLLLYIAFSLLDSWKFSKTKTLL